MAVRALLRGDTCDLAGKEVTIHDVRLDTAPVSVPILAGVRGPRSLEVAGRVADGVVLAGYAGPEYIASARAVVDEQRHAPGHVVAAARFALDEGDSQRSATTRMRDDLASNLDALGDMVPTQRAADIDTDVLRAVSITGSPAELWAGIQAWHNAGADIVSLDPLSPGDLDAALTALEAGDLRTGS